LPVEALLLNSEAHRQWRGVHCAADAGQDRFMTLLVTHPACLAHEMGEGNPDGPDRLRAIERAFESEAFQMLARDIAPRADIAAIARVHPIEYVDSLRAGTPTQGLTVIDQDTSMSPANAKSLRFESAPKNRAHQGIIVNDENCSWVRQPSPFRLFRSCPGPPGIGSPPVVTRRP